MNTLIEKQPIGSVRPSELCDWLTERGIATVTAEECSHLLGAPRAEVPQRLARPRAKGHLVGLARGLWAAVPAEYRAMGAPEPMRYIDDLMVFYRMEYCIGWLSAAALRGASHQAPQTFQVAVHRQVRDRTIGRASLEFHKRTYVPRLSAGRVSTFAGSAVAATAGATMLMVAADPAICGGLDNVATVVAELADENPGYLAEALGDALLFPKSAACRLGWILEHIAGVDGLDGLAEVCRSSDEPALLSPNSKRTGRIDKKWNVLLNRKVEADL